MRYAALICILLSGCSIIPREGKTPEVQIHVAGSFCDTVKIKDYGKGIIFTCTTNF